MKEPFDIFVFAGQSNMAGRGEAELAPTIPEGRAFEFRAISDPARLYPLVEPFGFSENYTLGIYEPGMKTGGLAASFAKIYTERTGRKLVGISASKGGSSIAQWQKGELYYNDLVNRLDRAKAWLSEHDYGIDHVYMLWLQGETDGDLKMSGELYSRLTGNLFNCLREYGFEHIFMIRIGDKNGDSGAYNEIQQAQEALALERTDVTMVSTCLKKRSLNGLMKDSFHFHQEAYNACGEEAAINVIKTVERCKNKLADW